MNGISINKHSSIRMEKEGRVLYFDPFEIDTENHDADIIFVTHDHYDHFDPKSIELIKKENTVLVMPERMKDDLSKTTIKKDNLVTMVPDEEKEVLGIKIETVKSYNVGKKFHLKEMNNLGFIVTLEGKKYYVAGDTDLNEDTLAVKCDIAFVPVGGTYTTTAKEAATLVNEIKPEIAVPTHYGSVVGKKKDGGGFIKRVNNEIKCIELIK